MVVGNLAALAQSNLKRMLAYSSIAHAGYLLMALIVAGGDLARQALLFYLAVYTAMTRRLVRRHRRRASARPASRRRSSRSAAGASRGRSSARRSRSSCSRSAASRPPPASSRSSTCSARAIDHGYTYLAVVGASRPSSRSATTCASAWRSTTAARDAAAPVTAGARLTRRPASPPCWPSPSCSGSASTRRTCSTGPATPRHARAAPSGLNCSVRSRSGGRRALACRDRDSPSPRSCDLRPSPRVSCSWSWSSPRIGDSDSRSECSPRRRSGRRCAADSRRRRAPARGELDARLHLRATSTGSRSPATWRTDSDAGGAGAVVAPRLVVRAPPSLILQDRRPGPASTPRDPRLLPHGNAASVSPPSAARRDVELPPGRSGRRRVVGQHRGAGGTSGSSLTAGHPLLDRGARPSAARPAGHHHVPDPLSPGPRRR